MFSRKSLKHSLSIHLFLRDAAIQVEFSRRKDIINETKAREKADARMQELASQGARRGVLCRFVFHL